MHALTVQNCNIASSRRGMYLDSGHFEVERYQPDRCPVILPHSDTAVTMTVS